MIVHVEPSPVPSDPTLRLTPKQATEALAAMHAKYMEANKPPASAVPVVNDARRLNEVMKDRDFGARVMGGDIEATKEFRRLNESVSDPANRVELALAGEVPRDFVDGVPGSLPLRDMAEAAKDLRARGWSEAAVREAMGGIDQRTGKAFDAETIRQAKNLREARLSDPEWRAKLLRGERSVTLESQYLTSIIASETPDL